MDKGEVVEVEGLIVCEVNWEGETWKVGAVYVRDNMKKVLKKLRREVDERKGEKGWIIRGDFNARTGEEGRLEDGEMGVKRRSLDKMINKQGEELLKWGGRMGNNERS